MVDVSFCRLHLWAPLIDIAYGIYSHCCDSQQYRDRRDMIGQRLNYLPSGTALFKVRLRTHFNLLMITLSPNQRWPVCPRRISTSDEVSIEGGNRSPACSDGRRNTRSCVFSVSHLDDFTVPPLCRFPRYHSCGICIYSSLTSRKHPLIVSLGP